ncbi:MAG: FG-GAP repeat protein [Thermoanaerobaculia bacterium]
MSHKLSVVVPVLLLALSSSQRSLIGEIQDLPVLEEQQKIWASDGVVEDRFGFSIALNREFLVVGAIGNDAAGVPNVGAAYVFRRDQSSGSWQEEAKLSVIGGDAYDVFGAFVAVRGTTVFVSAPQDDDWGVDSGAVYVYRKDGDLNWIMTQKLYAPDHRSHHGFGGPLAVGGDLLVVGALDDDLGFLAGAAYVFREDPLALGTWSHLTKLTASEGQDLDSFGSSVAIDGDLIVVGADNDDHDGTRSGSAYVFERCHRCFSQFREVQKLVPPDAGEDFEFGGAVAVSDGWLAVGAKSEGEDPLRSGATYLYKRQTGLWEFATKLKAPDAAGENRFGSDVDLGDAGLLIGAYGDGAGSAYLYQLAESQEDWLLNTKLRGSDSVWVDYFGGRLAMAGSHLAIAAELHGTPNGYRSGAAYTFDLEVFGDGFESGSTAAWTATVP